MFTWDRMVLFSDILTFTLFLNVIWEVHGSPILSEWYIIWYICQRNPITGADRYKFLWSGTRILYQYGHIYVTHTQPEIRLILIVKETDRMKKKMPFYTYSFHKIISSVSKRLLRLMILDLIIIYYDYKFVTTARGRCVYIMKKKYRLLYIGQNRYRISWILWRQRRT